MAPTGGRLPRSAFARALRAGWVVLVGAALATVPFGCGGSGGGAATDSASSNAPPATELVTGFETGTTRGLTDSAHATVTSTAAKNGRFGFEVDAAASDAYGRWDAGGTGRAFWSFRAWVRILAWTPNESVDLFTVQNREVTNNFDLFVGATDRAFQWDLYRENSARAPGAVELGRWYLVESQGSFASTNSTADVQIDGTPLPSITSPGQPPSAVKAFVLGSIGTKKTNRVQYDDVRIEVSDQPIGRFDSEGTRP